MVCLLAILVAIPYSSSLDNNFVNWDDSVYVIDNPLIKELSWQNIKKIFCSCLAGNYHPLVLISYSIEYFFFKLDPFIYHLTNLSLHILNCLLVFWVILLISSSISISFLTALFFGIHPLHVESVAWVSERKDVLSTLFFLATLISYWYSKINNKRYLYHLSILLFLLALLSKPMVITLPLVILLLEYHHGTKFNLSDKIPFFMLSIIFGVITIFSQYSAKAMAYISSLTVLDNLLIALRNIVFYLSRFFIPHRLCAFYPYPEKIGILSADFYTSLILLLVITLVLYHSKRYTNKVIFGFLFFLLTIFPVLKLFPIGSAVAADRYMYIPSIGLTYMAGFAFQRAYVSKIHFDRVKKWCLVIMLLVIYMVFSNMTWKMSNTWQDSETLWQNVLKNYPQSVKAHTNLALAYIEKGSLDKAVNQCKKALAINPHYVRARNVLGIAYDKKGMVDEAIVVYRKALSINPHDKETLANLGLAYIEKGEFDKAIVECKKALAINPDCVVAHNNLGIAYTKRGMLDEALVEFKEVLRVNPYSKDAHNNLAVIYCLKGEYKLAVEHCNKLMALGYGIQTKMSELLKDHMD